MTDNNDVQEYLERYCKSRKVTTEEAMSHALVREVVKYYELMKRGGV